MRYRYIRPCLDAHLPSVLCFILPLSVAFCTSTCYRRGRPNFFKRDANVNTDSDASETSELTDPKPIDTTVIGGPFSVNKFASSHCWGRRPLLVRSAFDANTLLCSADDGEEGCSWPSWNNVALLSCEDDGESRLISHRPGDSSSWELELGPFEDGDVCNILNDNTNKDSIAAESEDKWTLVVNDVDRFFPSLADWVDQEYSFIPRWRRDDAQISLADVGGGIGPHVDNYDVFLIQMLGTRTWEVGKRLISVEEEFNSLVDGLDVRILSSWEDDCKSGNVERFVLEPGDLLYLPPRIAHCGVALTNSCMTLSVGCRAPSATDMTSRLAEMMTNSFSGKAVERIRDDDLLEGGLLDNSGEITELAKTRARQLVQSAVEEYLDDDDKWDAIFGQLVTGSPQRQRMNYPAPLTDGDEVDLGVWGNAKTAVSAMLEGNGVLYQAEGITFGYSLASGKKEKKSFRLFINGEFWDVSCTTNEEEAASLLRILTNQRRLDRDVLAEGALKQEQKCLPSDLVALLEDLVGKGFLYGSDE